MRALVTGGAGFIGSNLVDRLVGRGDRVVVIDDLSTGRREHLTDALARGAELVVDDIRDGDRVRAICAELLPDVVFHLAAQMDVRRSVEDPAFDADVNIRGTVNLLEATRLVEPESARFVFASTGGAIYGEGEGRELPLDEDAECRPDSPYGQSKMAGEGYCRLYERLYGLSTVSMRLGNVYGPRQDPLGEAGVVAIFCGRLTAGESPTVFGDGRQTRDFVYVGDIVAALIAAASSDARGPYNVGTGRESSVLDLIDVLDDLTEGDGPPPHMAAARAGEVRRIAILSERAARDLGWRAATGLEEGLERTLAWFRAGDSGADGG